MRSPRRGKKKEMIHKQAEKIFRKHDLHPALAYKHSDGTGEMSTLVNVGFFQKSSQDPHVPYMINSPSNALSEIVDDVDFKKVAITAPSGPKSF